MKKAFIIMLLVWPCLARPQSTSWQPWQKGFLDIHHIHTGRGNATYMIFPDGTTLLVDAGDMDAAGFTERNHPLKITPLYPHDSLTAGQWIARYITQVAPPSMPLQLDYALITHFHADHYGEVMSSSPVSSNGYKLTGITQVASLVPVKNLIDRGYPGYNYPVDLKVYYKDNETFQNYLKFVEHHTRGGTLSGMSLQPGMRDQIRLLHAPADYGDFQVTNIKANGTIGTGRGDKTRVLFQPGDVLDHRKKFNENPLSLAIKITYGNFSYYTGGDNTGLKGYGMPAWFDVETPMATAIGKVTAMALDHHGNRDATNEIFLKTLSPRLIIQQTWCSDHPGQEVMHRIISGDIYPGARTVMATALHEETLVYMGPWMKKNYIGQYGHIALRVTPGSSVCQVFVLKSTATGLVIDTTIPVTIENDFRTKP